MKLDGKVAIVTGASRGVGASAAVALAREGVAVACAARATDADPLRLPGTIDATVREITDVGGDALAVPTNLANEEEIHRMVAVTVEHFGRTYTTATGSVPAVDDLSFQVSAGEIVGLIGPNGAGKTTTLRALAGILKPTSGHVRIDGLDLIAEPIEAKRRLAFMPDEPHLFEYLTVAEHLRLIARLYAVDDFERRSRTLLDAGCGPASG